jgi:hypothetical protein
VLKITILTPIKINKAGKKKKNKLYPSSHHPIKDDRRMGY